MSGQGDRAPKARFSGVLDEDEVERARALGAELAYCPVQLGWVHVGGDEDDEGDAPLSWQMRLGSGAVTVLHKRVEGTPVYRKAGTLVFRPWSEADLPSYGAILRDPALWTHMPEETPARLDDETLLQLIALSNGGDHHLVRAAWHEGRAIGQTRLEFGPDGRGGELSYWLDPAARGMGLGRKMVAQFLDDIATAHPQIRRIAARVHPENAASRNLLVACGFRPCERAASGLGPRGRDQGDWHSFLRETR